MDRRQRERARQERMHTVDSGTTFAGGRSKNRLAPGRLWSGRDLQNPRIGSATAQATTPHGQRRDEESEHEPAHMGEERDAAAVCTRSK